MDQVVVVGGGLAGVTACNTVVENGGKTVLIDKSAFCGGNSTKATSGINGSATRVQKAKGVDDSNELFLKDTVKGGAKKPELAKVLCENSGEDVDWLMDVFDIDLSLLSRLGGHSAPRTHRGKERFPGMTITYALIQMVEQIGEKTDKARIITKARVTRLLQNDAGDVVGLTYFDLRQRGLQFEERGPVILCTGGFGADFASNSLLAQHRPDLMHLPTTNGEHCTGDGIKMGEAIGARTIDLEWVQVHPTGLVKPDDADAKVKFLAAEALRGVGGLILNKDGQRIANELGRRDYVTGEMWKNNGPFRLVLNKAASDEIIWHCKHYTGRGVMKFYESGEAFAKDIDVPLAVLEKTHQDHYEAAQKQEKDPDGGKWPAYPFGKSWDEASGKTGSGKKFFHNIIPGSEVRTQPLYVAIITPVIHYCMGGLEVDEVGAVIGRTGAPIKGLYCAGEVAGGIHGNNRLGGNSLLDCVVFGRVTGRAATKDILGGHVKTVDLKELTGRTPAVKSDTPVVVAEEMSGSSSGLTLAEVAKHTTKDDCWVVIAGQVLNVTKFLPDHPGGDLAVLTFAGKDATEEFNMIHPPDVIAKYAPDSVLGNLCTSTSAVAVAEKVNGDGGYTLAEVARHATKDDCWVVVAGQVLNVTKFLPDHPGGDLAILTLAGKDCTEEFGMIHPPDVIQKYAPDSVIGTVASGQSSPVDAASDLAENAGKSGGGDGGYTLAEVAKHTTKNDCWVVVGGQVLNVTKFLPDHPGGELAVLTFAGKDATDEFNMIHPPDVIPKYAPDCVIGKLDTSASSGDCAKKEKKAKSGALTLREVAKHTTKDDCWVVVAGQVLNVTKFLPDHPGGELAVLTFAGKDATEEFNMIHPPDVIPKYAPDAIIGSLAPDDSDDEDISRGGDGDSTSKVVALNKGDGLSGQGPSPAQASGYPPLDKMVEGFKQSIGVDGDNLARVVSAACHELGVPEESRTLIVKAELCWDRIYGRPT